jgi:hypothetical protein
MFFQKPKMREHWMIIGESDPVDDAHAFRFGFHSVKLDAAWGRVQFHTLKIGVEIEMPPGTAKLAIGGELQSDLLLLLDYARDLAILDRFEVSRANLAPLTFRARLFERRWP